MKLDFEPALLNEKVSSMLPNTISEIVSEKDAASKKLEEVEAEMNNAITKVEELGIRKDEALSNQAKLNEYFDLALSGNINITRDAITSLLDKFDFNENEGREAAKLLMFPEDALYEYDATLKSGDKQSGKTISEVIAEAKQESKDQIFDTVALDQKVEVESEKEEDVPNIGEVKESVNETPILEDIFSQVIEKIEMPKEEQVKNEDNKSEKEKLLQVLNESGLNEFNFKDEDLKKIMEHYDKDTLTKNVNTLKSNKISLDILKDNVELLYDKELDEKINKLLSLGKVARDINLVPSVLTKYDLKGLNNTINVLQISGLDPEKVPLMAY